jgi:hypothetical protein
VNDVAEIESKITAFAREPHGGLICPSDTGAPDLFPQQPLWPTVVAGALPPLETPIFRDFYDRGLAPVFFFASGQPFINPALTVPL